MVKETKKIVKFEDLNLRAKVNCLDNYINVVCPYEDFDGFGEWRVGMTDLDELVEDIEYCLEESDALTIDEDGCWYDEGRVMR